MERPSITDEYERRGIETIIMENEHLRVEVLAGKGGDVTELRDKHTDVNVLFETPHEWYGLDKGGIGVSDGDLDFLDHYPGGWQDVLPAAGSAATVADAPFAQHGETPIVPWDARIIEDSDERVTVELSVDLSRYPLAVERTLSVAADDPTLRVAERVTNRGEVDVDYSWLQHIALGRPLIGPDARLDADCRRVLVDPDHDPETRRLPKGVEFEWPVCLTDDAEYDLSTFPDLDAAIHDIAALTDFEDGRYTVSNPELDLSATVRFDENLYEYVWYWGAFGGFEAAPFFGRNYNVGLEPSTSRPVAGLERQIDNGTANRLSAGESVETELSVEIGGGDTSV